MAYFKLKLKDDWGSYGYVIGFGKPDLLDSLKNLELIQVRFADGKEMDLPLRCVKVENHVKDMGHEYTVLSERAYVQAALCGTAVLIPLEDIEVFIK